MGKIEQAFGMSEEDIEELLSHTLKPEEIAGTGAVQHARVHELVRWFLRYGRRSASTKWLAAHAFELAYYIATMASNRFIDLDAVRQKAFMEGVNITPAERSMLERLKQ